MNKQELIGAILNNIKLLNRYPMTRDNQVWLRKQAIEDLQRIYDGTARQLQLRSYHSAIEHNCTFDKNGKAIDDMGNEYRDENGQVIYK